MIKEREAQLKMAERGAIVSIIAYVIVAVFKLVVGDLTHSKALFADGLNNATDIVASITVLIGLRLARKPADDDHRYGHWKMESLASLLTSLVMIVVGGQVFVEALTHLFNKQTDVPDSIAAIVGIVSAIFMFGVYLYNHRLAKKVKSHALDAAAKDNLSDAITSIGTAIAVFASSFNLIWIDRLTALIIGLVIIKTGFDIFKESSYSLSDGFSIEELRKYKKDILHIEGVEGVKDIKGRSYGANIFLDVVVFMDPHITVEESHDITETIEQLLSDKYNVFDTDIHVEPLQEKESE
ncbi:cation diffusion facilitator family transporter [Vagococcus xieshaowenii]|uniref:Cation transporter n=1 Tax=Vagococcus xieshaowenii TaxID=2562451 RepID=A0AAJ5JQQ2_9ENTE|nr:cation diffusion facilitator family transporter [Vagococcus xieshaowenii]QCA28343.1 cation transporter [Vagococcus xieshaowenii]TFZ42269.1 cation transporter [Vagococcus xieshaowenii]